MRNQSNSFSIVVSHGSVFSSVKEVLQVSSTLSAALTEVNLNFLYLNLPTLIIESFSRQISWASDIRFLAKTLVPCPFIWRP